MKKAPQIAICGAWVDLVCRVFQTLLSRANCPCQTAVIDTVCGVPQRLAQFDAAAQHLNLVGAASRRIGGDELLVFLGDKVFVVPVTENRFEDILALTHKLKIPELELLGPLFQTAFQVVGLTGSS